MHRKKGTPKKTVSSKKDVASKKVSAKKNGVQKAMGQKVTRPRGRSAIRIKCNVGYGNNLFIRGQGPGLSWMQGVLLTNVAPDEWIWETSEPFDQCEFKVLVNDKDYEAGDNHRLPPGAIVQYTPCF